MSDRTNSIIHNIVFGNQDHLPAQWEEWTTQDGLDGGNGFACPRCHTPEDSYAQRGCFKNYDVSISAAYEVMIEIGKRGFIWHISSTNLMDEKIVWLCRLCKDEPNGIEYSSEAETIPSAVSQVVLLKGTYD